MTTHQNRPEKDHILLRPDTLIQNQMLPLASYLQFLHTIPTHFCQKLGHSFTQALSKQTIVQKVTAQYSLMFPFLVGSSPPLKQIKCNKNCSLRYDDKTIHTISHSQISIRIIWATLAQLRLQSLLTQLILAEMDQTAPKWVDPQGDAEEREFQDRSSNVFYCYKQRQKEMSPTAAS